MTNQKEGSGQSGSSNSMAEKAKLALKKAKDSGGSMTSLNSEEIEAVFNRYRVSIAASLPKQLTPDRMIQMATTMVSSSPELRECSSSSILGAFLQAASLGFKPIAQLGQCYFYPRNRNIGTKQAPQWIKECVFQIGYRGFIDLCERSGKLKAIFAYTVHPGEEFSVQYGTDPKIHHVPSFGDEDTITHVYAVAQFNNGGMNFIVMTHDEVEKLRILSPGQGPTPSGIWADHYGEMSKAKAVRRLAKWLPLSDQERQAIETDQSVIPLEAFNGKELLLERTIQDNAE